jgi:uncharacterized protein YciI
MKTKVLISTLIVFFTMSLILWAQQKSEPESKLVQFQMALLKHTFQTASMSPNVDALQAEHLAYLKSLLESGKAVIAGPLVEAAELRAVLIFRTNSAEEAKTLAENDPLVKAGFAIVEMHPWWAEEVMKKPSQPIKMTTAYLGILVRGPKWTPEKTPQTEELQKAHLANIIRLAEMKKLVVAGPFGDNGDLRGIFVFKVASLDEAKSLAETDPAVKAGRLAINMHTWSVPEGVLP